MTASVVHSARWEHDEGEACFVCDEGASRIAVVKPERLEWLERCDRLGELLALAAEQVHPAASPEVWERLQQAIKAWDKGAPPKAPLVVEDFEIPLRCKCGAERADEGECSDCGEMVVEDRPF
jgi:hypothetical protein